MFVWHHRSLVSASRDIHTSNTIFLPSYASFCVKLTLIDIYDRSLEEAGTAKHSVRLLYCYGIPFQIITRFGLRRVAYERLFHSSTPLSKLQDAAFGGRLLSREPNQSGVVGRSMAWKVFTVITTCICSMVTEMDCIYCPT